MAYSDYVNLNEYAQLNKGTVRGYVSENLVWHSKIAEILPIENLNALSTTIVSYDALPSMGFRKINATYSQTKGTFKQKTEVISAMGGYIDVDKLMVKANKQQIANQLVLSAKTVSTYRARLLHKMGMTSGAELTRYALTQGLVD